MHWLDLPRVDDEEMIDSPDQPLGDVDAAMADLARVNLYFGGVDAVVRNVAALIPCPSPSRGTSECGRGLRRVRILDIGTGSGDIPRALVRWARTSGIDIDVVAVDNLCGMLQIARDRTDPSDPIRFLQADALALPFAPNSFDIATCGLMLHHLGVDAAARVVAQMDALSTRGFVVTDLRRDRLSLALVRAGLALLRAHPITRHDGPASVRRAFTRREYEKIVALSGVRGVRMTSSWYYRVVLVKEHI